MYPFFKQMLKVDVIKQNPIELISGKFVCEL